MFWNFIANKTEEYRNLPKKFGKVKLLLLLLQSTWLFDSVCECKSFEKDEKLLLVIVFSEEVNVLPTLNVGIFPGNGRKSSLISKLGRLKKLSVCPCILNTGEELFVAPKHINHLYTIFLKKQSLLLNIFSFVFVGPCWFVAALFLVKRQAVSYMSFASCSADCAFLQKTK